MFWVFDHVVKPLDQKAKINFKIYDVKDWEKNNYNTHIAQDLKKCEGNLTMKFDQLVKNNVRNYVYQNAMQKMRQGDWWFKNLYVTSQQVNALFLIYLGRLPLGHTTKTSYIAFQNDDPEICSILIFVKGSGTSFPTSYCAWFFKKNISQFIFITDQILLFRCSYFLRCWAMCIAIIYFPVCDVINF